MKNVWKTASIAVALLLITALGVRAADVSFTSKPSATKTGDKVNIRFAVSAPTDVAVFVEDSKGDVIRHLVAGVLGKNPPPPLKPGLVQELEWDGKADYGQAATGGPFRVRVAMGLSAKYDRVVSAKPQNMENVVGMGTGPDGTLYVRNLGSPAVWNHTQLLALDKDGNYLRTLFPYPSNLKKDQVAGYGAIMLDGRYAPGDYSNKDYFTSARSLSDELTGYHTPFAAGAGIAVSGDGRELYLLVGRRAPYTEPGIVRMGTDGSSSFAPFSEPLSPGKNLGVGEKLAAPAAISSDGKDLFFSGLTADANGAKPLNAVHRVSLPERKGMVIFFGAPNKTGAGKELLGGAPAGLAIDGKGNLLIADGANGRVVAVSEIDGKYAGELKVEGISSLGVSRKTGAIYAAVQKGGARLLKFASLTAEKPAAEFALSTGGFPFFITVDPVAATPVIWIGTRKGQLFRVEDKEGKFEARTISPGYKDGTQEGYVGLTVDRLRKEIYVRNGLSGGLWQRFSEKTGKLDTILTPEGNGGGGKGMQLSPGQDGNLYGLAWPYRFYRWDRDGKPVAWANPKRPWPEDYNPMDPEQRVGAMPPLKPHMAVIPVAMGELPHTLGVRWSDGHFLIQEATVPVPGSGAKTMKSLHEYAPSGERLTKLDSPIIWKMSDAAVGPKIDAAGNIYIAEVVRPKGWMFPDELARAVGEKATQENAVLMASMYGSIVKFSPKGGMFHYPLEGPTHASGPDPFKGQPKLDGLKSAEYDTFRGKLIPLKVTGAEWVHPGMGHVGFYRCNCENVTFDVDEFGRAFFPDLPLYRVRVIDTAGNAITHFGGYGNPESMGPESPGVDEKTGKLRPPKAGEKSPLSEPDIALGWLTGVGVTDRYAYMGDAMNRRLLRAKLVYAAEETCAIP